MRSLRSLVFGAATVIAAGGMALAQGDYPNQMVRIVVPFSAGSITDGLARILADKLATLWKQQVIVENRAGLPGTTGVAKSAPDGYTLMLTSNGHTIAGVINKNLQFDPPSSGPTPSATATSCAPRASAPIDAAGCKAGAMTRPARCRSPAASGSAPDSSPSA